MRPAGPGDGLRRRLLALPRAEAGAARSRSRAAGGHLHDPVHLLHPLHPVPDRGGGRAGDGHDRAWRGCAGHVLSRADAGQRVAGQRDRPLPGRGTDIEALCVHRAAVGAGQVRVDRRDGRARLQHPGGREGARGDADHAAQPRRGERGVAGRPLAVHLGRTAPAAAGPALRAGRRQAEAHDLGRGVRGGGEGGRGPQGDGADRRSGAGRGGVCAARAGDGAGRDARVPDRRREAAGGEPVGLRGQRRDRGHRRRRRGPARRHQPPDRGAGAECAASRRVAAGRQGRAGRRGGRSHLRLSPRRGGSRGAEDGSGRAARRARTRWRGSSSSGRAR